VLAVKRSDVATGIPLLRAGFDELREAKFAVMRLITFAMVEALGHAGEISEGLAAVEEAVAQSEHTEGRFLLAGLLHLKGELLLLQGGPGASTTAEDHFRQALDWARRQGALSWELRAATSLARLLRDQDRSAVPWRSSGRSTTGSPKGSTPPISKQERLFSTPSIKRPR